MKTIVSESLVISHFKFDGFFIYPTNIKDYLDNTSTEFYIIDGANKYLFNLNTDTYELVSNNMTIDAKYQIISDCYDPITYDFIAESITSADTTQRNEETSFFFDTTTMTLTDYDSTAFATFDNFNQFTLIGRYVYYIKNNQIYKRDILNRTEEQLFTIDCGFFLSKHLDYSDVFFIMTETHSYTVHNDTIIKIQKRNDKFLPTNKQYYARRDKDFIVFTFLSDRVNKESRYYNNGDLIDDETHSGINWYVPYYLNINHTSGYAIEGYNIKNDIPMIVYKHDQSDNFLPEGTSRLIVTEIPHDYTSSLCMNINKVQPIVNTIVLESNTQFTRIGTPLNDIEKTTFGFGKQLFINDSTDSYKTIHIDSTITPLPLYDNFLINGDENYQLTYAGLNETTHVFPHCYIINTDNTETIIFNNNHQELYRIEYITKNFQLHKTDSTCIIYTDDTTLTEILNFSVSDAPPLPFKINPHVTFDYDFTSTTVGGWNSAFSPSKIEATEKLSDITLMYSTDNSTWTQKLLDSTTMELDNTGDLITSDNIGNIINLPVGYYRIETPKNRKSFIFTDSTLTPDTNIYWIKPDQTSLTEMVSVPFQRIQLYDMTTYEPDTTTIYGNDTTIGSYLWLNSSTINTKIQTTTTDTIILTKEGGVFDTRKDKFFYLDKSQDAIFINNDFRIQNDRIYYKDKQIFVWDVDYLVIHISENYIQFNNKEFFLVDNPFTSFEVVYVARNNKKYNYFIRLGD